MSNIAIATAAIGISAYIMATLATKRALRIDARRSVPGAQGEPGPQGPQGEPGPTVFCACPAVDL